MNTTHKAISGYRIKMQDCINAQVRQGRVSISQEDLGLCMGVRISAAFRRHISEMQAEGLVTRFTYQTEKGGYKVAYVIGEFVAVKEQANNAGILF